jgi:hypothetical protein
MFEESGQGPEFEISNLKFRIRPFTIEPPILKPQRSNAVGITFCQCCTSQRTLVELWDFLL